MFKIPELEVKMMAIENVIATSDVIDEGEGGENEFPIG